MNPVLIKSVDGLQFGFVVFQGNECIKSVEPSMTKPQAQEMMERWEKERELK